MSEGQRRKSEKRIYCKVCLFVALIFDFLVVNTIPHCFPFLFQEPDVSLRFGQQTFFSVDLMELLNAIDLA